MYCSNPHHNTAERCTKEVSCKVAGGEAEARRMLKTWILWGAGEASRDMHKKTWQFVKEHQEASFALPAEAYLDRQVFKEWPCDRIGLIALPPLPPGSSADPGPASKGITMDSPLRYEHDERVPQAICAEIEGLWRLGTMPVTTLSQRSHHKPSKGSIYTVPPFLCLAFEYGYIHPDLAPPVGYKWVLRGLEYRLVRKGG